MTRYAAFLRGVMPFSCKRATRSRSRSSAQSRRIQLLKKKHRIDSDSHGSDRFREKDER